jgi:hypothetical protein
VNRYFVFHANVKKGTTTTTLAPTIQTHMPQPPRSIPQAADFSGIHCTRANELQGGRVAA